MDWISKYWIEVLFGLIIAFLSSLWRSLKKYQREQNAIKEGMKGILHDRIVQKCTFLLERGYYTPDDLEDLEYLNIPYMALGGNGSAKRMLNKVYELPMRSE